MPTDKTTMTPTASADAAVALLRQHVVGTDSTGRTIRLEDILVERGTDVEALARQIFQLNRDAARNLLAWVFEGARIDGEPCPDPEDMAETLIRRLRDAPAPARSVADDLPEEKSPTLLASFPVLFTAMVVGSIFVFGGVTLLGILLSAAGAWYVSRRAG